MTLRRLGDGVIADYDDLVACIRARIQEIGATAETVGRLGGVTEGYITKILAGRRMKVFGKMSLSVILGALSLKFVPMVDVEAAAKLAHRLPRCQRPDRWTAPAEWAEIRAAAADREMKFSPAELGLPVDGAPVPPATPPPSQFVRGKHKQARAA